MEFNLLILLAVSVKLNIIYLGTFTIFSRIYCYACNTESSISTFEGLELLHRENNLTHLAGAAALLKIPLRDFFIRGLWVSKT